MKDHIATQHLIKKYELFTKQRLNVSIKINQKFLSNVTQNNQSPKAPK